MNLLQNPAIILAGLLIAGLICAIAYVAFASDKPASDTDLLDFLDQTGYSLQRLGNGWCAVTNGSHKIVGRPSQDSREAIMSAVDGYVSGEVNNG